MASVLFFVGNQECLKVAFITIIIHPSIRPSQHLTDITEQNFSPMSLSLPLSQFLSSGLAFYSFEWEVISVEFCLQLY
jgi:hypothetical protein